MKPSDKTMTLFYQQLGKLFYSMALVDGKIQQEEITELKKIVRKEWITLEDSIDSFQTDTAYQIEIVFDWLIENKWDSKQLIADFKQFQKEHKSLFTKRINELILKTVKAIAVSFYRKNKSEQLIMNELDSLLL